jgi:hemoglobin-like flavoprotein
MSPEEIALVEATISHLDGQMPELARTFYAKLFAAAPETRPLFTTDLELQGAKFTDMLGYLVRSLRHWTSLEPAGRENGRRHVGYGVTTEHYQIAGTALIGALAEVAAPHWDEQTAQAWQAAYGLMAELMLTGARAGQASMSVASSLRPAAPVLE